MQLREQAASLRRAERKGAKKAAAKPGKIKGPLWHVDIAPQADELTVGRGDARLVEVQKIAQGLEAELRRHDEVAIAEFIESVALKRAYITPGQPQNFLCIPISQINAILRALDKK